MGFPGIGVGVASQLVRICAVDPPSNIQLSPACVYCVRSRKIPFSESSEARNSDCFSEMQNRLSFPGGERVEPRVEHVLLYGGKTADDGTLTYFRENRRTHRRE